VDSGGRVDCCCTGCGCGATCLSEETTASATFWASAFSGVDAASGTGAGLAGTAEGSDIRGGVVLRRFDGASPLTVSSSLSPQFEVFVCRRS
jgi:hypothetical protein